MSQNTKSQEFSPSFPYSDILAEELEAEIFQHVGSEDMNAILNADLSNNLGNGPYADSIYDHENIMPEENTVSFDDIKTFSFSAELMPQLVPLATNDILSNEEYLGPYEFDVSVLPNHKSKNPWVYSVVLNKVFMDMNQQFPVDFKIKNRPDKQLFVRTTPQYSAQHHAGEPVCRCIQHDHYADPTNKDIPEHERQHVIRCSNQYSQYVGNSKENQRLSIIFPLSVPQVGNETVRELFQFVCKSSCPHPGMNRRGIEVIFTLEDAQRNIYGRKCLKVRICACPKRDKEKEENEMKKSGSNGATRGKKRKTDPPPPHSGKAMAQQDDLKVYMLNIPVPGKQSLCEILSFAEKVYATKAYQHLGHPEEQVMKKALMEVQNIKRQLQ